MAAISLPQAFRSICKGETSISIDGLLSCGQLVQALAEKYPLLKKYLFDSSGQINRFLNIYVNDRDSRELPSHFIIQPNDQVTILTSLVGG